MSQQHPQPAPEKGTAPKGSPASATKEPADSEAESQQAERDPELQNEGEGSRSGARRYDAGATRTASDPRRVEKLAEDAAKELEGEEGASLRRAEERGRKGEHR